MGIINTNTRRENDENDSQSVSSLIQMYESMTMRETGYGLQNRIQRSERDGGHQVRSLIHKYERLAKDLRPETAIARKVRGSKRDLGQRVGSLINLFESMPMSGRVYGPQNRILNSERDGRHKVKALIHKLQNLAPTQSSNKLWEKNQWF